MVSISSENTPAGCNHTFYHATSSETTSDTATSPATVHETVTAPVWRQSLLTLCATPAPQALTSAQQL